MWKRRIFGSSQILDNAVVKNNARVVGGVISGEAQIGGDTTIIYSHVRDEAKVMGHYIVSVDSIVKGKSIVEGEGFIKESTVIDSEISGNSDIKLVNLKDCNIKDSLVKAFPNSTNSFENCLFRDYTKYFDASCEGKSFQAKVFFKEEILEEGDIALTELLADEKFIKEKITTKTQNISNSINR